MGILSNLIVRIGASTDDFDKAVDRSINKTKRFAADVTAAGEALSIGFSVPMIAAGAAAIKAGADLESMTMGLKAVMKTTEATTAEMARLREVAKLPGIGLEEAVRGSVRLQVLGKSAEDSRKIMIELGNAIGIVGGGKDDFNEVIRQLSQMGAAGKVTSENLRPIVERVPQIAAIIKEQFGPEALGKPAETLEKLGVDSSKFIDVIIRELQKGERAGNTYKNSWENVQMAAQEAAAEFGKTLLPIAQRVLDEFLTPGIEKAKALATAFAALPKPTQDWALGLTAVATAAPLFVVVLGTLIEKGSLLLGVLNKLPGLVSAAASGLAGGASSLAGALGAAGLAAGAAGAGVGLFLNWLISHGGKPVDTTAVAIQSLNEKLGYTAGAAKEAHVPFSLMTEKLIEYGKSLPPVKSAVAEVGAEIVVLTKAMDSAKLPSMDLLALFERARDAAKAKQEQIRFLADTMERYGVVTAEAAYKAAKSLDILFVSYRQLSDAPDLGNLNKIALKDLPKAKEVLGGSADTASPSSFEEFVKMGKNIGPEGMLTKEQLEQIKARYKDMSKTAKAAVHQVSLVINDLARGITDVIFNGGKIGDMFKNIALQAAQSITRLLIEGALKKLSDKLFDVGGLMGKVFGGAGGAGGTIFSAASSAGGGIASSGGGVGSAVGQVAGAAVSGVVGAVAGVVGAVSGIIGNFQMAGMNKTLDLIEKEVRYSQIHLLHLLENSNTYWPYMKTCWESLIRMEQRQMAVGAGGGVTINVNGGDPKQTLEDITRLLKQYGVIAR
jgi:tape measure domain-containing protein